MHAILTKGIAGFWTGGWGGGPLTLMSLGCLLTTGRAGGGSLGWSLGDSLCSLAGASRGESPLSRPANASESEAASAPMFPEGAGGSVGLVFSGEAFGGCCGGGNLGASIFTCPFGVEPRKLNVVLKKVKQAKSSYMLIILSNYTYQHGIASSQSECCRYANKYK